MDTTGDNSQPQSLTESAALCTEGSDLVFDVLQSVSDICGHFRPVVPVGPTVGSQQLPSQPSRPALADLTAALEAKLGRLRKIHATVAEAGRRVAEPDSARLLPLEGDEGDEDLLEGDIDEGGGDGEEAKRLVEHIGQLNDVIKRLASGNAQLIHQLSVMLSELPA